MIHFVTAGIALAALGVVIYDAVHQRRELKRRADL